MSKKVRVVIDTDGAADDIRAISIALQHPNVEIVAITTVCGCVTVDQTVANIARTLRANGREGISIYKGAERPLIGNIDLEKREQTFFGKDGMGDCPNEYPKVLPDDFTAHKQNEHAVLALTKIFKENRDLTLICIGPLTNIALAIKLENEFCSWPSKIVIMGGNIHAMGNVTANSTAEYNFSYDPEAAHIVLKEMKCEKVIIPWETFVWESNKKTIDFHKHLKIDHSLSNFFEMATRIGRKFLEEAGRQFSYCDEICVAVAIDPEKIVVTDKVIKGAVELHGTHTRGQVALGWIDRLVDDEHCPMKELRFIMDYSAENLDKLIHETIYKCTENSKK